MRVTGTPYSRAEMAVHFPVPFCPALSLIFGSRCSPSVSWNLRILAVISIRNESSSVLFHSSKACAQDVKENNVGELGLYRRCSLNWFIPFPCKYWPMLTACSTRGYQAPLQDTRTLLPPAEFYANQQSAASDFNLFMLIFWSPGQCFPQSQVSPHLTWVFVQSLSLITRSRAASSSRLLFFIIVITNRFYIFSHYCLSFQGPWGQGLCFFH